eukprot:snap_masked-scaffold_12-processed-gene-2.12-mRNA-1 protein AED:1.00 eAED:1.00 QI:0/0/0/0/1/1/3/0/66
MTFPLLLIRKLTVKNNDVSRVPKIIRQDVFSVTISSVEDVIATLSSENVIEFKMRINTPKMGALTN